MNTSEWPLICYTLLTQTAIGTYIMSFIIHNRLQKRWNGENAYTLILPALYLSGILVFLGLAVSLFHLGSPLSAPNSILNLGASWLSREILLTGGFAFLWLATVWLARYKKQFSNVLVIAASVVGLLDIYAMSKIYATTLIPAWQGLHTFIAFYATCFILGTLLSIGATLFTMNKEKTSQQNQLFINVLAPVSYTVLLAIAIQMVIAPTYFVSLAAHNGASQASALILSNQYGFMLGLRWFLMILGGAALVLIAWRQMINTQNSVMPLNAQAETAATSETRTHAIPMSMIYLTFVIMVAGEVIGRYLFYASGVQVILGLI